MPTLNHSDPAGPIEGVVVTELRQIIDERGAVLHMLRSDAADFTGFGECYFSEILPGVVKAWKRHRRQTQNFAVPNGRIRVVIYDDRRSSGTLGHLQILELGRPDAYRRLTVPPGLWYGFSCLGASPALLANCCDLTHDPSESETQPVNCPAIPYAW